MGVLDKYRIRGVVKSKFNPGRNNNWDWNELLTTIENNFESDFDLAALEANVENNKVAAAANTVAIALNADTLTTKATTASVTALTGTVEALSTQLSANLEKVAAICACLTAAGVECAACER